MRSLVTLAGAVAYAWLVSVVYVEYLNPVFGYAGFGIVARPGWMAFATGLLAVLPVLLRSRVPTGPSVLAALVHALYFVPSLWCVHHGLEREVGEVLALEAVLAACMAALFLASRKHRVFALDLRVVDDRAILLLTAGAIVLIGLAYRGTMRFVGFADVYELRFEAVDSGASLVVGYATMWCTYCLLPYALATGILNRRVVPLFLGVAGSIVVYMATGAKSAILSPLILLGVYVILRLRGDFLGKLLVAATAGSLVLLFVLPAGPFFDWARSVVLMRTIGSSGWTTAVYYDYFSRFGFTRYSHIGAVDAWTGDYRYGPYSLGQLIGIEITGSDASNFNAGFWSSDGVAAAGLWGLPIATALVIVYFRLLHVAASGSDPRLVALWACGFGMALLNLPFSTAMVSGGGLLLLVLLCLVRTPGSRLAVQGRREPAATASA